MSDERESPYVKNCILISRDPLGRCVFFLHEDGRIDPYLDGYVIIPKEQYADPVIRTSILEGIDE